jgi:hypothetical protein
MHHFKDKARQIQNVFEILEQNPKQDEKIINTCPEMSGFHKFT